jgi:hypothetical protein
MAHSHFSHPHLPFHLHVPTHFHAPAPLRIGQGMRDSLWLFAALGIMLGVAAVVQWLFSMV